VERGAGVLDELPVLRGKSSDAHTVRVYVLENTGNTVQEASLEEPSAVLEPLNLEMWGTGACMLVLYDGASPAFLMFDLLETGAYYHQWFHLLPAASAYTLSGQAWQVYDPYVDSSLGLAYAGYQVGHRTYATQVSALTFHRTDQNCLDQAASYMAASDPGKTLSWLSYPVALATSADAFYLLARPFTAQELLGVTVGTASGAHGHHRALRDRARTRSRRCPDCARTLRSYLLSYKTMCSSFLMRLHSHPNLPHNHRRGLARLHALLCWHRRRLQLRVRRQLRHRLHLRHGNCHSRRHSKPHHHRQRPHAHWLRLSCRGLLSFPLELNLHLSLRTGKSCHHQCLV